MATLNAILLQSKAGKKGNKVRISVAHNGQTCYIVTDIVLNSDKEFKNGLVVRRADANFLNTKIRGIMQRYQTAIDELEYTEGLTCSELISAIQTMNKDRHRTIESIFEEYMDRSKAKDSSQKIYRLFWKSIKKHIRENMIVDHVTQSVVLSLDKSLHDTKIKNTTIRNYMIFFRSLIIYAKRCGYAQLKVDPFLGYSFPQAEIRQAWLSVDEIRKIRDVELSKKNLMKCRDLFMLSYYLGGINISDLVRINFNENKDTIRYERKKTETSNKINKYVEFEIPAEAKAIIDRYRSKDGLLAVTEYQRKTCCTAFFEKNMPKLAKAAGLKYAIFYSARKSFSQHAFNLGIKESVIDFILGHQLAKGGKSLYNYIYVTPDMATDALRKVLDNLK